MKKYLYIALAAAALTSCSQDETLDVVQGEAIAFSNAFVENSTRAYDPSYGGHVALTSFNVWGTVSGIDNTGSTPTNTLVPVFANTQVTGAVGTGTWNTVDVTQYWIPEAKYNFAAVVNGGNNVSLGTDKLPASVVFTSDGATDLLYAKSEQNIVGLPKGQTNSPVELTFEHMLAKAVFTVKNITNSGLNNTNNSGYYYKVSNIQITNANTVGTCTFSSKEWTSQGTPAIVEFGNITNGTNNALDNATEIPDRSEQTSDFERMLIPFDYGTTTTTVDTDDLIITFNVQLYLDKGQNADELISNQNVTKKVAIEFEKGYAYNFIIELGLGNPIQFKVASNPIWTDASDQTITVQ